LSICSPPSGVGGESCFISELHLIECQFITADQLQYLIKGKFLMCDIKEYGILEIIGDLHNSAATPRDRTHFTQRMGGWVGSRCSLATYDYRRMVPHSFIQLSLTPVTVMSTVSHFCFCRNIHSA